MLTVDENTNRNSAGESVVNARALLGGEYQTMQQQVTHKPPRIPELDGLRALAALMVMLYHYTVNNPYSKDIITVPFGHYGVELFFVLSGYVITMTLVSKESLSVFALARFRRLFPIYWFCVLLTGSFVAFFGFEYMKRSWVEFSLNFTMIQWFLGSRHVDGSYWSLQYELFFYCLIALLYYKLRLGINRICWIFAGIGLVEIFRNVLDLNEASKSWPRIASSVYYRVYGLLFVPYAHLFLVGIASYGMRHLPINGARYFILWSLLVAASSGWANLLATGLVLAVFTATLKYKPAMMRSRVMVSLGAASYVLYMIHLYLGRILIHRLLDFGASPYLAIALGSVSIILLALLIHHKVEKPLAAWVAKPFGAT